MDFQVNEMTKCLSQIWNSTLVDAFWLLLNRSKKLGSQSVSGMDVLHDFSVHFFYKNEVYKKDRMEITKI